MGNSRPDYRSWAGLLSKAYPLLKQGHRYTGILAAVCLLLLSTGATQGEEHRHGSGTPLDSQQVLAEFADTTDLDNAMDPAMSDHTASHDPGHDDPRYACPMHPDQTSQAPGRCAICGMFLVAKAEPTTAELAMDMTHDRDGHEESHQRQQMMPDKEPTLHDAEGMASGHGMHDKHYVCPMHPQIVSSDPDATCPICGMDLVEKHAARREAGAPQVFLPSNVIQNMGVRIHTAKRGRLAKSVKTQGIVTPDDERILYIHPRTGGWVERLYHFSEGDRVERKEELLDFYSPWINQAQLDLITALEELDMVSFDPSRKGQLEAKVDSLRNTLRLLKVSPMDVMRIEKSRQVLNTVQIMAPQGGLITELNVSEGSFVEPYESMFTIVDLSEIWVMVDIFEHQAPWVRKGQEVTITTPAIPGREWRGSLEFIYPEVNPKTRTLRARIEVPNPDEALLLNMFVQVDLSAASSKADTLSIPREAIMLTGEREIVVKALGKGHFQPVEVTTGLWGDQQVEVLSGVEEGDEIVVSGQFLIDSESNIQSSLLRMAE